MRKTFTPGSPEWDQRVAKLIQEEMKTPERWLYLSFADNGFLGGVFLQAHGTITAMQKAHALGINPGGQMLCVEQHGNTPPDPKWCNRLLTKAEVIASDKYASHSPEDIAAVLKAASGGRAKAKS